VCSPFSLPVYSVIEDARLLLETDEERQLYDQQRLLDQTVEQQLCYIDPVATGSTEENPSGFDFCENPDRSVNNNFRCMKFMYLTNPEAPGVCLQTTVVDKIAQGNVSLSIPFQLKLFHAVTQKYTSDQIDLAREVIQGALGQEGLGGKIDEVKIKVDAANGKLDTIKSDVDTNRLPHQAWSWKNGGWCHHASRRNNETRGARRGPSLSWQERCILRKS
jgi:hypothetical protein